MGRGASVGTDVGVAGGAVVAGAVGETDCLPPPQAPSRMAANNSSKQIRLTLINQRSRCSDEKMSTRPFYRRIVFSTEF